MERPIRLAALFYPNGCRQDRWTPEQTGRELEAHVRSWNRSASGRPTCRSSPACGIKPRTPATDTMLRTPPGSPARPSPRPRASISTAAACRWIRSPRGRLGKYTPLPSLELGTEAVRSGIDAAVGYTRVYGAHIAWRTPTQPLAKEINPRLVFDRMTTIAAGKPTGRSNRPLLDRVGEDAKRLSQTLGQHDRQRLDQYLESVHALEQRLSRLEANSENTWRSKVDFATREAPPNDPQEHAERTRLMLDMIALAFEADITRVATFMFGNSVSDINFSFLEGVEGKPPRDVAP